MSSTPLPSDPGRDRSLVPTIFISTILLVGVILSAVALAIGLGLFLSHGGQAASPESLVFASVPKGLLAGISSTVSGVGRADPASIAQLGVLLLLATPVMRVAASVLLFLAEKDWLYVIITLIVLAILLTSILALH